MFATEVFGFPSDIESSEESNRVLEASPLTNEQDKEGTLTGPVNISRPRSNASSDIEHLAAYNPRNSCGPSETSGTDDTSLSDITEPEELDEERGSTLKAGKISLSITQIVQILVSLLFALSVMLVCVL